VFREVFGRNILGIDVAEPLGESRFRADIVAKQLPGLNILWAQYSPLRGARTRAQLADGNDGLAFQWSASPSVGDHMGHEIVLGSNDGVLISCSDPGGSAFPSAASMVSLAFPRDSFAPVGEIADRAGHPVPANVPAFALLRRYVDILRDENATATFALGKLAAIHVLDLLALAVGLADRDTAHIARGRGVRAAQLSAIKKEIVENAGRTFSLESVSARHGLSPRHIQRLFEDEGTSFTQFLREQRLLLAYRMVASPRFAHLRISDIAFEAGFADLSWFNRQFRQRFGASPRDLRQS
jgi:AraC-like DNA-binding protein